MITRKKAGILATVASLGVLASALWTHCSAQMHYEAGMYNTGPLATEVTARVRTSSLPGAMYLGFSIDGKLYKGLGLTGHLHVPFTVMQIQPCIYNQCSQTPVNRYNWRPAKYEPLTEVPLWIFDTGIGLRETYKVASVAAGVAVPVFICDYSHCGATPMATKGLWAEGRIEIPVAERVTIGLNGGVTYVPPEGKGITVMSEFSGFKQNGQPWPAPGHDPSHLAMVHIGISLSRE